MSRREIADEIDANAERQNALCQELLQDLEDHRQETRASFRSVHEQLAQIRDLIVDGFRGRGQ